MTNSFDIPDERYPGSPPQNVAQGNKDDIAAKMEKSLEESPDVYKKCKAAFVESHLFGSGPATPGDQKILDDWAKIGGNAAFGPRPITLGDQSGVSQGRQWEKEQTKEEE